MLNRTLVSSLRSFALLCLLAVCAAAQTPPAIDTKPAGDTTPESSKDYRLGAGDVLTIEVAGEPDLKRKVKVMEGGTIQLPYIDHALKVGGLTEPQATELLRREFLSILKEPQVTLFIDEYHARMASIAGAVNQPKQIALTRDLRLYDLISLAGGLTDKAGNIVQLIRTRPEDSLETIDVRELVRRPELNRVIRDGDFVNVPESGVFYVSGNVIKPGAYPLKETVRLTQAIAIAGGLAPDSKKREIKLVRAAGPNESKPIEQIVDLVALEKNPTEDIELRPYDIVLVPESARAKQARSMIQTFAGGLASALGWGILR